MDYRAEASDIVREFLSYHEIIRGHSAKTVDEYYLDIRTFIRFMKRKRGLTPQDAPFEEIAVNDAGLDFFAAVTKADVYDFMTFLSRERARRPGGGLQKGGLAAVSRARKLASLKSLFKYLTVKTGKLDRNPLEDFDPPRLKKSLPKHLSLEESKALLSAVGGRNAVRDRCILTIFLNCGLRISELTGLNLGDIRGDSLRILGKGNKERIVYFNDSTAEAINEYLAVRKKRGADNPALFLSERKGRIASATVHRLVKLHLGEAGLDSSAYSAHKLRHTAATLMLKNGVDVKVLQQLLGHEHLNTTEIYAHVESTDLKIAAMANPLAHFKPMFSEVDTRHKKEKR
jgi:site-specific recombinase XerD